MHKKFSLFCVVFLFIIGFKFSNGIDLSIASGFLIILLSLILPEKPVVLSRLFISVLPFYFIALSLVFSSLISSELGALILAGKIVFYVTSCMALACILDFIYKERSKLVFYEMFTLCILIHSLVVVIQYINVEFRNLVYQYSDISDLMLTKVGEYRMAGFSGGGGALLSLLHALGFLSLYKVYISVRLNKFIFIVCSLLITLAIILMARSGLFLIMLYILVLSLRSYLRFISLVSVLVIVSVLAMFVESPWLPEIFELPVERFMREIRNIFGGGESYGTISILGGMYFYPGLEGVEHLFGKATSGRGVDYLSSDIGYVRGLYMGGLVYISLLVALCFSLFAVMVLKSRDDKVVSILILISVFMMEGKEMILWGRHILPLVIILYCLAVIDNARSNLFRDYSLSLKKKVGLKE